MPPVMSVLRASPGMGTIARSSGTAEGSDDEPRRTARIVPNDPSAGCSRRCSAGELPPGGGGFDERFRVNRRLRTRVEHGGETYTVGKGDVWLLPAVLEACAFRPGSAVTLLEVALPE
jgi:hypothetical protein